jgi:hypothetical protein
LEEDVRKLSGHPGGKLPGKLRNPWLGPYKMVRWVGDRKCVILENKKEVEYDVNRLFKHHSWDEDHFDTSGLVPGAEPVPKEARGRKAKTGYVALPATPPEIGEAIIFPLDMAPDHNAPFGVGRILKVRGEKLQFQWLGNAGYEYNDSFLPGWKNVSEDLGYYKAKKLAVTDVPWTGDMTGTPMDTSFVFARGRDLLTIEKCLLTAKAKRAIVQELGREGDWKRVA